ncbi:hypothetical protein CEXT_773831 [Caerostris extrusa]|uniref:Uncharacterized protein n=1 Tax=Caerostris extrusa TaxID=172846 RepID=A0AAV4X197_CAEEX|nr:hypothetical protein CEXT_773831 [Caerostris extrusa]
MILRQNDKQMYSLDSVNRFHEFVVAAASETPEELGAQEVARGSVDEETLRSSFILARDIELGCEIKTKPSSLYGCDIGPKEMQVLVEPDFTKNFRRTRILFRKKDIRSLRPL